MKPRRIWIAALMLIALAGTLAAQAELRVVFANVWSGLTYHGTFSVGRYETKEDRAFRYGLLIRNLKELEPDVVILNEANPLPRYARRVARDLSMDYVHAIRSGGVRLGPVGFPTNLREGDVILARPEFELEYIGNRNLVGGPSGNVGSFHLGYPTHVVGARVTVGNGELFLFTTRWADTEPATTERLVLLAEKYADGTIDGIEYEHRVQDAIDGRNRRALESERTLEYIDEVADDAPLILAGTLHAGPDTEEVSALIEAGLSDSWTYQAPGYTRDGTKNTVMQTYLAPTEGLPPVRERVDYLFYQGEEVRLSRTSLAFWEPTMEVHLSDHFGLVVDIVLPEYPAPEEDAE